MVAVFKAMTWNVENLFVPEMGSLPEARQRFERKLELLAGVIGRLEPDVVALQEVGGEEPLRALQQALGEIYPHGAVSAFPDGRGSRVAFLSRHGIEDRTDLVDFPAGPALDIHDVTATGEPRPIRRMSRGALRVRVQKEGLTIDLITTHLKSKLLTFPRPGAASFVPRDETERSQVAGIALSRRMAEAVTLRIRINELLSGNDRTPLLLLGDVNDVPEAQTSLILCGPPGSEIHTGGFDRPDEGDDVRLFNLTPLIPEARRFSRIERGRPELLDQIFASEEFFPPGDDGRRRLPEADSHVDLSDSFPSVGGDPGERAGEILPDHAPVTAKFEL